MKIWLFKAFQSLLKWKRGTFHIHFSLKGWVNVLFELSSGMVKRIVFLTQRRIHYFLRTRKSSYATGGIPSSGPFCAGAAGWRSTSRGTRSAVTRKKTTTAATTRPTRTTTRITRARGRPTPHQGAKRTGTNPAPRLRRDGARSRARNPRTTAAAAAVTTVTWTERTTRGTGTQAVRLGPTVSSAWWWVGFIAAQWAKQHFMLLIHSRNLGHWGACNMMLCDLDLVTTRQYAASETEVATYSKFKSVFSSVW